MHIPKMTAHERTVAQNILDGIDYKIHDASHLLYTVWEDYFDWAEPEALDKLAAKHVGIVLRTVIDVIDDTLLELALRTDNPYYRDQTAIFFEHAQAAQRVQDINTASDQICERARRLPQPEREVLLKRREHAFSLPDEQALTLLKGILKEAI